MRWQRLQKLSENTCWKDTTVKLRLKGLGCYRDSKKKCLKNNDVVNSMKRKNPFTKICTLAASQKSEDEWLTVGMHWFISIGICWLRLDHLGLLVVLQLLLSAGHYIWHDSINEREALHGPFRSILQPKKLQVNVFEICTSYPLLHLQRWFPLQCTASLFVWWKGVLQVEQVLRWCWTGICGIQCQMCKQNAGNLMQQPQRIKVIRRQHSFALWQVTLTGFLKISVYQEIDLITWETHVNFSSCMARR